MGLRSLLTVRPAGKQCGGSEWRGRAASESCFNHWDKFLKSQSVLRFPHPASRGYYEIRAQWKGKQRKGQKGYPESAYLQCTAAFSLIPERKCQGGKEAAPAAKP